MSPFLTSILALCLAAAGLAAEPAVVEGPSTLLYPTYWHTPMGVHRGTAHMLKAFLGPQARFANPQGLACAHLTALGGDDDQLTVVGVNAGLCQLVYNPNYRSLKTFGSFGHGDGQFMGPMGVAMAPDGRVAVADTGNHRVALLRFSEGELRWEGALGRQGAVPGAFDTPTWVAFDGDGTLWVSDSGNNRLQAFAADGRLVAAVGGDILDHPQAIAVRLADDKGFAPGGGNWIYVVDRFHDRLWRLGLDGSPQKRARAQSTGLPSAAFCGLALDWLGNVWVADQANHRIHKFDPDLNHLDSWGGFGEGDGQFDSPRGLAINRPYGQVLVLERNSAQYLWLGADIKGLALSRRALPGGGGFLRADFTLTEKAKVEAWLEDEGGRNLRRIAAGQVLPSGENAVTWDGYLDGGAKAPAGRYQLALEARATYSSRDYFVRKVVKWFNLR